MAAPVVTIYKNGDNHFYGKKLVVNPKNITTFDNFLDKVTHDTQARVAIRRLCTPNHGSRIIKLDQLQNGGIYVAVGAERFKKLQYDALRSHPAFQSKKPQNQNIKPVLHSRIHVSARHKKVAESEPLRNRIIYVYSNGDPTHPGIKLLLDKRILKSMDIVLQYVTDKIKLRTGAVKSLHTLDGEEIKETKEFVTGSRYVAVGYGKVFIKTMYAQNTSFSVTPRRSKNPDSVNSSSKYKGLKKIEAKIRKKSLTDRPENKKVKSEKKWKTQSKKGKTEEENMSHDDSGDTSFLAQLNDRLDTVVDNTSDNTTNFLKSSFDYNEKPDSSKDNSPNNNVTSFLKSSFDYNENDINVKNEKHVHDSDKSSPLNFIEEVEKTGKEISDDVKKNMNYGGAGREGTFDRFTPNTDNTLSSSDEPVTPTKKESVVDTKKTSVNDKEIHDKRKKSISKSKKKKANAFGTAYEKTNANNHSTNSSDHTSESHSGSRKNSLINPKEKEPSIELARKPSTESARKPSIESPRKPSIESNKKTSIVSHRKPSVESHKLKRASINSTNDNISKTVNLKDDNEILVENNNNNELSGTPPAPTLSEKQSSKDVVETSEKPLSTPTSSQKNTSSDIKIADKSKETLIDNNEDETIEDTKKSSEHVVENQNNVINEEDVVSEVEDNIKSDSTIVYEASGQQREKADLVKDNQETNVEKTIDMQEAEEVDEEIIETEDADDDRNTDDKNLITIKN